MAEIGWRSRWMEPLLSDAGTGGKFAGFRSFAAKAEVRDFRAAPGLMTASVADGGREFAARIRFGTVSEAAWEDITGALAGQGRFSANLLAGQMPEGIEEIFRGVGASFFPRAASDLYWACDCSGEAVFCRHLARLYAYAAEVLEKDPFLIFTLKGKTKEALLTDIRVKRPVIAGTKESGLTKEEENPGNFWILGVPLQELRDKVSAIPARTD